MGVVGSTRPYRPWLMIHHEVYKTRSQAMQRERWYKTGIGRTHIEQHLIGDFMKANTAIASSEGGRP